MHSPYHDLENSCPLTSKVNVTFKNLNGYKTSHIFTN